MQSSSKTLLRLFLATLATAIVGAAALGCSVNTQSQAPAAGDGGKSPTGTALDGSYSGTFRGDDTGPVTMTVSGTNVDVVATVGGKQYPASGTLTASGAVNVGIGVGAGVVVTFDGTFADGKGSGTWKSSVATKGTWSVAK